jgi:hypothetical protein
MPASGFQESAYNYLFKLPACNSLIYIKLYFLIILLLNNLL